MRAGRVSNGRRRRVAEGIPGAERATKTTQESRMPTKIQPLGDRVLVAPVKEEEAKKGGIIIPDTAKEKPTNGKVIAIGTGKLDDNGKKIPFNVKVGDKVLMPKYGGTEVKIDDKEYQIVREEDILGIVTQ
jgi:chaperonin GroES